jgi:SAM-dependent methyltransferase
MPPIPLLTKLDLLEGNKTVLDVGCKDGATALLFAKLGLTVDAIDIHAPREPLENISFRQISIEDFLTENTREFDIVVARHILPFTKKPLDLVEKLNSIAGVFMFTCFGPQDEWHGREDVVTITHEKVKGLFSATSIRHRSETFEYSTTYTGNIKFWHVHTFVIDNRA